MTLKRLVTAADIVARDAMPDLKTWFASVAMGNGQRFTGRMKGDPVDALVDWGRWSARCPDPDCSGSVYVDPEDPIFYCNNCGNDLNDGDLYPVNFPSKTDRKKIAKILLARPVKEKKVPGGPAAVAYNSTPTILGPLGEPLIPRSWDPSISIDELKKDNKDNGVPEEIPDSELEE